MAEDLLIYLALSCFFAGLLCGMGLLRLWQILYRKGLFELTSNRYFRRRKRVPNASTKGKR